MRIDHSKLSADLAIVAEVLAHYAPAVLRRSASPLRTSPTSGGSPLLPVFIECDTLAQIDPPAGVHIHQDCGDVRTAMVTPDALGSLSQLTEIRRIRGTRRLRPTLDIAVNVAHIATFRQAANLTGTGVIIGIVDTGIDASHPAFVGRILSIWDQELPGKGWGATKYGRVLRGAQVDLGTDEEGHGTHVAGIACGQDAQGGRSGVAPGADLIVVKTSFEDAAIADGIRYIFAEAKALGRPAVVNLSMGGHYDAHDGTDPLSLIIAQESGPGRIVVASAGNEGELAIHAELALQPDETAELILQVPQAKKRGATPWVTLNGWYGGDTTCELKLRTSSGDETEWRSVSPLGGKPVRTDTFDSAVVRTSTPAATTNTNGDHQFVLDLMPSAGHDHVRGGKWRLFIRNTGDTSATVHVWSNTPAFDESQHEVTEAKFLEGASSRCLIGSPGCATAGITVAAYTSRIAWKDTSGAAQDVGLTLGEIADFSSPGPLRDGGEKPDLAAPGAMIASCLSGQWEADPTDIIAAHTVVMSGTSMASPFVAGAVALLLQRDPSLTPAAARTLLRGCARRPDGTGGHHDPLWGYGLLDARNL